MKKPPNTRAELRDRLLANRVVTPGGCWIWTNSTDRNGYGRTGLRRPDKPRDRPTYVHRVAMWVWKEFDLQSPLYVLHRCDVPSCFNPDHLFLGTAAENTADMIRKGRWKPGKPISDDLIAKLQRLRASGLTYQQAAEEVGVALSTAWRHTR